MSWPRQTFFYRLIIIFLIVSFTFSGWPPILNLPFLPQIVKEVGQPVKPAKATYQFNPVSGTIVTGTEQTITSATAAATEGVNVGSWKGTLADDNFHWVIGGTSSGVDVNLDVGDVALNGANTLMVQTEFDLDATVLSTLVQICDWVSSTGVDNGVDTACTGGGWRTLNLRKAAITATAATAYHWQIYDGFFTDGSNSPISTPLSNFVNASHLVKIRYYSTTNTATTIAIDYTRVYAVINPVYSTAALVNEGGGTVTGDYSYTVINTGAANQSDNYRLEVAGTAGTPPEFYLKYKNVKTYTGMNTIVAVAESSCSASTAGLSYKFKIRNFHGTASEADDTWEDMSSTIECYTTEVVDYFAKNNIDISNYINSSNEIWIGAYGSGNSTTAIRLDYIYITLGTTNTDEADCEISFGSQTAGRIASNPGGHLSDKINDLELDDTYMYIAGYDSVGYDYEWRIEKRNQSDGSLVTAFGTNGIVQSDPSSGNGAINAIALTSDSIIVAGYDGAGAQEWRIEKRNKTTGELDTNFDTDGVITVNPTADVDWITAIETDDNYLYIAGFEDDDTGTWRIEKRNLSDGALVTDFDTDGIIQETLTATAGDERPQSIKVDDNYIYVSGYDYQAGNVEWRIEKRDKTTGALITDFDTDGIVQVNPSAGIDAIYTSAIDSSYIYLAGYDSAVTGGEWRIEKRDITTGALVTAFDTDGIIQADQIASRADIIYSLKVDDTYLYLGGYADLATGNTGQWRLQKRNKTTGALDTNFSTDGTAQSDDGGDDRIMGIAIDASNIYAAGYGTGPGDNQWLIEKRELATGLRVSSGFGGGTCVGTRDLDTTSGDRSVWAIQTEDESTNFSHSYYALDTDGDVNVEEAGSANIGFSVTVPDNAAVTGIFWAGRLMSGSGGTVRLAVKDYSGLTGTNGGRSLVGSSPTYAMTYTDAVLLGNTAVTSAGGPAGYMINPEDYIDTVNNQMRLNLNTTADGATTVNSVNIWDFAMVSFSWVETGSSAVISITIDQSTFDYGNINSNTASSTLSLFDGQGLVATNGSATADFYIYGANSTGTGSGWTLASDNANNNYIHRFCNDTDSDCTNPPDNYSALTSSPALLKSSVTAGGTVSFQLQITTPTTPNDLSQQSAVVTIQASEP